MSHKASEDKKQPQYPRTPRQRRAKVGNRKLRKQNRTRTRNL